MTLPMTSAAEMIDEAYNLLHQDGQEAVERGKGIASCALAAATLEAARLTLDAQASNLLSALEEPEPETAFFCGKEWVDGDAAIMGDFKKRHEGKPHRCVYTAGHEKDDPHYCHCGSEL